MELAAVAYCLAASVACMETLVAGATGTAAGATLGEATAPAVGAAGVSVRAGPYTGRRWTWWWNTCAGGGDGNGGGGRGGSSGGSHSPDPQSTYGGRDGGGGDGDGSGGGGDGAPPRDTALDAAGENDQFGPIPGQHVMPCQRLTQGLARHPPVVDRPVRPAERLIQPC